MTALVIAHNPGPVREARWSRVRYFVGHDTRTRAAERVSVSVVFPCRYIPTDATHGLIYAYCEGPFRLKREAMERAGMRPVWNVQQYWGRTDGWETVTAEITRREAIAAVALYRSEQPGIPARIRREWE